MRKPKIDTDWHGEFLQLFVAGGAVLMHRKGAAVELTLRGDTSAGLKLTAAQADSLATSLASAAEIIRRAGGRYVDGEQVVIERG